MKKFWLYAKLVGIVLLAAAAIVVYFILRKGPTPPSLGDDDATPPEPIVPTNFVTRMRAREKGIRDEIDKLSRDKLLDSINREYGDR